ncbi:hypothetical protein ABW19_dt0209746 [Dactylella cylindrospora]|nr:hypothetical protein ABW19_dt0209746 [Dactylella cylindrospora]
MRSVRSVGVSSKFGACIVHSNLTKRQAAPTFWNHWDYEVFGPVKPEELEVKKEALRSLSTTDFLEDENCSMPQVSEHHSRGLATGRPIACAGEIMISGVNSIPDIGVAMANCRGLITMGLVMLDHVIRGDSWYNRTNIPSTVPVTFWKNRHYNYTAGPLGEKAEFNFTTKEIGRIQNWVEPRGIWWLVVSVVKDKCPFNKTSSEMVFDVGG